MYKIPETRKHVRIEKPYITRFNVKSSEQMIFNDWDMVAVINLSAGGLFFYAKKNLEVGTILDLKIGFSLSNPSIICNGKVIRAKRHLDTSIIGFAIEFTQITEHARKAINNTVEEIVE
ncbi:MAG: PilZ domain-containing protein [Candidatus Scalindua sp.]|jgi:hypothetical protein|nr:PilZ domain-containing protein [Candidatus Scalindua sp.]